MIAAVTNDNQLVLIDPQQLDLFMGYEIVQKFLDNQKFISFSLYFTTREKRVLNETEKQLRKKKNSSMDRKRRRIMVSSPSFHGMSFHGPSLHGPSLHGPSFHGPSFHGPSFHGPSFQQLMGPSRKRNRNETNIQLRKNSPMYRNTKRRRIMVGPSFHGPSLHSPSRKRYRNETNTQSRKNSRKRMRKSSFT
jgi:hypothetical protein